MEYKEKPKNYLVLAIISTVLCCMPFGVVSIVKAAKVDALWYQGRYDEAEEASTSAKTWGIIAMVCGFILGCISFWVEFFDTFLGGY